MKTKYPYSRQFWLLFWGFIINRTANGLIWPFLTLYMRQQLNVPLSTVTLLFSVQAVAGLISTSIAGSLMDRFGRKGIIVASMVGGSVVLVAMRSAATLEAWAILIALYGVFIPVFTVGGNAMVADLVPEEGRTGAYALIRMAQNVGVAIGPAVGGFLIVSAYGVTYLITAGVYVILAGLIWLFVSESLPERKQDAPRQTGGGYAPLLRDKPFLGFIGGFVLVEMVITLVFILLPVYVKENFGILENQYGLLVTINAVMVVFLQFAVTRVTSRYHELPVLIVGSLVYAVGIFSVALGSSFAAFALSMVVVTVGELIVAPTGLSLVARLAPADMRARYMGVYALTWTIASGTAPFIGGVLSDTIAPAAIWYGGLVMGLAAAFVFYLLIRARSTEADRLAHPTPAFQE